MVQTTNGIFNKTLYDLSTPKALLAWHRVRLANWLASSGEEWANYVSQYNSGMYVQTIRQIFVIIILLYNNVHVHSKITDTHILSHLHAQEPTTISIWYWT